MTRALIGASLLIGVLALVLGVVAYREAKQVTAPTYAEITEAGVRDFRDSGNRMTPKEVRALLGRPDEVYRNNPRALCWSYSAPYTINMCWGPKRQQAWISTDIPRDFVPS